MADRSRLPAWWAVALVVLCGAGALLVNVLVRDTGVWPALAAAAVVVALPLLAMVVVRGRRGPVDEDPPPLPPPAPHQQDVDIHHADAPALLEFANQVATRIEGWRDPELGDEERNYAEQAQAAIDAIIDTMSDICSDEHLPRQILPRIRTTMTVVKGLTAQKPNGASGWFRLKDRMEVQVGGLRGAVAEAGNRKT